MNISNSLPSNPYCHINPDHSTDRYDRHPRDHTIFVCNACYQKILTQQQILKRRSCYIDSSHKTHQWRRHPQNRNIFVCNACYRKILTQQQILGEGKSCHIDPSHNTDQWHRHPRDRTIFVCNTCYRKILSEQQTLKGRSCHINSSHGTRQWYINPEVRSTFLCGSCYQKAQRKKHLHNLSNNAQPQKKRKLSIITKDTPLTEDLFLLKLTDEMFPGLDEFFSEEGEAVS